MRNALVALAVLVGGYFVATKLELTEDIDMGFEMPRFGGTVRHR